MHPVISEIASRAWMYANGRLNELLEKDNGKDELPTEDKRLRNFILRFQAGSLFLDLFQSNEIKRLVDEVFTNLEIQAFVFDLQWYATVGIDKKDIGYAISSVAYTLTPNFVKPVADGFKLPLTHDVVQAISSLEFEDHKWKLSEDIIIATLFYLPWLMPLLLISVGELAGAIDGSDLNINQS